MNLDSNIYHRYLNLPFEYPKPERFNHPHDSFCLLLDQYEIYAPFKQWVESHGLTISNVLEGIYTEPNGGRAPLHSDTDYLPGVNDICKLNFTWGPADSTTRWYRAADESKLIKRYFGDDEHNAAFTQAGIVPDLNVDYSLVANWEDVDLVYEAVIDRPSLLNISQLHSTYNPSPDNFRWTLCFALIEKDQQPLSFARALEIFKEYIGNKNEI